MFFQPRFPTLLAMPYRSQPDIYLDANATTRVLPQAIAAAACAMEQRFGNPSSSHAGGLVAKEWLEQTRERARQVLGAGDGHIVFNSGATEGLQTAVLSALCDIRARGTGGLLVYGATEHKAVPQALAHWNAVLGLGLELRALPVDSHGRHDLRQLAVWLPDTALLCTMAANNETGVVSDLAAIAALLHRQRRRALWLVDGVQALGKLELDLQGLGIDYAAFSGHKLYAPKGIGLLYVRRGAPFTPLMAGGGQEDGMRAGTENMAGIAALGAVLQALQDGGSFADAATLRGYRDRLAQALRAAFPAIAFNAPLEHSLPTTLNFSVAGHTSKTLLDVFDAAGLRVSAGSACSSAQAAASHVLDAMGLDPGRSASALRLSIGALTTDDEITEACAAIARCGLALAEPPTDASALPVAPGDAHALTLRWDGLSDFLDAHPDAQLVDVREACEQQAGALSHSGCRTVSVPLGRLQALAHQWAEERAPAPRVLVCRSGRRSLQAALWLRSVGVAQVWHLHGGLALRQ